MVKIEVPVVTLSTFYIDLCCLKHKFNVCILSERYLRKGLQFCCSNISSVCVKCGQYLLHVNTFFCPTEIYLSEGIEVCPGICMCLSFHS